MSGYHVVMTRNGAVKGEAPAAQLFDQVAEIADDANRQKSSVDKVAAAKLERLDELDQGVVQTLYSLLPQIRRQIQERESDKSVVTGVAGRSEDTPEALTGALLVAAQAHNTTITGYHSLGVEITATPESTPEGLMQDFQAQWTAQPSAEPMM